MLHDQRLRNQRLVGTGLTRPEEVVRWLGAVQSQDYGAAAWGLAQRANGVARTDVDDALAAGAILRTHVLRPTWHFVTPADIRWMLALTAPRVHALNAYYYRKSGLDDALFGRSHEVLNEALRGGRQRTRKDLAGALEQDGIVADGLRLSYIFMQAELEGLICSGGLSGRQQTYALLDERVPPADPRSREDALAELVVRFFTSRGPARPHDFAWWAGLTVADARAGLARAGARLAEKVIDGTTYWSGPSAGADAPATTVHLLPNYDEYLMAYRDGDGATFPEGALDGHIVIVDGRIAGGWRRTIERRLVFIEATLLTDLDQAHGDALDAAARRYGDFVGMPVTVTRHLQPG